MIRHHPMRTFKLLAVILLVTIINRPGHAFEIEIKDNKLSVAADQVPMKELLKRIATEHGIIVRMDPSINPPVTASFQNRELEDGLKSILKPHNHVLYWKAASNPKNTPSAPPYQLSQIHIFKPGGKERMVNISAPPAPKQATLVAQQRALPRTKVTIKGNKVFVPVTLAYQDKEIETTLLFDTGASSIVLHENVAEQLEIDEFRTSQGRGVGGLRIDTKVARLSYVKVGPNKKKNLRVDIVAYEGPADEEYNGLLGMNFLRGLKYTIDFDNQTILWAP